MNLPALPRENPPFDVLVVTAPTEKSAHAYKDELEIRISLKFGKDHGILLLAVSDPEGKRIGSGGGTLNALDAVHRMLLTSANTAISKRRILMIHSGGDSQRSPTTSVSGKAWSSMNSLSIATSAAYYSYCNTPLDLMLEQFCHIFQGIPQGSLVVASSDVMLILPRPPQRYNWVLKGSGSVVGLATKVGAALGLNHGVYVTMHDGLADEGEIQTVKKYLQKPTLDEMKNAGAVFVSEDEEVVNIDTGVLYFSPEATEALIELLYHEAFLGCTSRGVNNGKHKSLRLELYSDMLLALSGGLGKCYHDYLWGESAGKKESVAEEIKRARQILWEELSKLKFRVLTPLQSKFAHLGTTAELMAMMTMKVKYFDESFYLSPRACCRLHHGQGDQGILLNSILECESAIGEGAVIEHCWIKPGIKLEVGHGAFLSGLSIKPETGTRGASKDVRVNPGFVVQQTRLHTLSRVLIIFHVTDPIKAAYGTEEARIWGLTWDQLFQLLGHRVSPETIWPNTSSSLRTLWHARLFPVLSSNNHHSREEEEVDKSASILWVQDLARGIVPSPEIIESWIEARRLSLSEILNLGEPALEFQWRRSLEMELNKSSREKALTEARGEILEVLLRGPSRKGQESSRCSLDEIWQPLSPEDGIWLVEEIESFLLQDSQSVHCRSILATAFNLMARLLQRQEASTFIDDSADGNVTESASNRQWRSLIEKFAVEPSKAIFAELINLRKAGPEAMGLAAKHYEEITYTMVRHQVATVRHFIVASSSVAALQRVGQCVVALAPARIDLAGGWSDTPPISYELGGTVVNLAVKLNGRRPIGAKVTLTSSEQVLLRLKARQADGSVQEMLCHDLAEFCQPLSAGCPLVLLKCALLYCRIIRVDDTAPSLADQLSARLHGNYGLEVESWSELPTGSGLGTSSILAGTILAAVARACGQIYSVTSLNHAILEMEQKITSGGGWQDQVGGLVGGIKVTTSAPSLPLHILHEVVPLSSTIKHVLEKHLVLVYTGKQRLARNVLRNVLRNYYARSPLILETISQLVTNANATHQALLHDDINELGRCLSQYWQQKKIMATDTGVASNNSPPEPLYITRLMKALQPYALGMSLCGAGGGGFLCLVTRQGILEPVPTNDGTILKDVLEEIVRDTTGVVKGSNYVFPIQIDEEGLIIRVTEDYEYGGVTAAGRS